MSDETETLLRILSIDAWRDGQGWTWNNWHHVGDISKSDFEKLQGRPNPMLAMFRERGYLTARSKGRCIIDDDGYNVVVHARGTGEPLFAIEYGPHY